MRTWYDRTGRSKNAVRTQLCLSLYLFEIFFSRCVHVCRRPCTFSGRRTVAVRSRMIAVRSDGGICVVLLHSRQTKHFLRNNSESLFICIISNAYFQTNGFFIECGALDGERASNTMWLENKRGWNGLLIEMDPSYYMQIRGKNRKSLSMNACLSPYQYPTKVNT